MSNQKYNLDGSWNLEIYACLKACPMGEKSARQNFGNLISVLLEKDYLYRTNRHPRGGYYGYLKCTAKGEELLKTMLENKNSKTSDFKSDSEILRQAYAFLTFLPPTIALSDLEAPQRHLETLTEMWGWTHRIQVGLSTPHICITPLGQIMRELYKNEGNSNE